MFNFILSVLVFAGFFLFNGVATDLPVVGKLKPTSFSAQSLLPGDQILAMDGIETPDLEAFIRVANALPPAATTGYRVARKGAEATVTGPYPLPPLVDAVQPQSAAMAAGMAIGDMVLSIDGTPVSSFDEMREIIGASDGKPLKLQVWRAGEVLELTMVPRRMDIPRNEGGFETRWLIGLTGGLVFDPETRTPGPIETLKLGVGQSWNVATTSLSGLWHVVTGAISTCNLRGPIGIAESSGAAASLGAANFVWFIAMLSTAVGLLNLFPVPVLDGGHLVFHAWEAVSGKPPSDRALRILMTTGLACLAMLMLFALRNDIFCP